MNHKVNSFTLFLFLMMTGCASTQLENIQDVNEQKGMLVERPIRFTLGSSAIMMSGTEVGLLPGYYRATKENEHGTFYLGTGQCLLYKENGQYKVVEGGVWHPKSPINKARLFAVIGAPSAESKSIEEATSLCKTPKPTDDHKGLTKADLSTFIAAPTAFGVTPSGAHGGLTLSQARGGAIGMSIAQAIADTANGEYQIAQFIEDHEAIHEIEEAIALDRKIESK